jgi:predicted dienelactone hydrolase
VKLHFQIGSLFAGIAVLMAQGSAASAAGKADATPTRLPREDLLLWRNEANVILPVHTVADWQRRRAEVVRGMEAVMGPLPGAEKRVALDVRVVEEVDCGSYVRRLITYQSEPDAGAASGRTPAYLCIPKAALTSQRKFPAVLCLHPTDNQTGHGVVVGVGGRPNRQYASELAERGYVTIAPNYPHLAAYRPDLKALGYASGTMKAVWDNIRALDVLETLPFVRPGRFGAIGHSLGGHNAVYTAVFEPRIAVVVSSCGLDSYLDYYAGNPAVWQPGKGWCQERYMPRLAEYAGRLEQIPFDFHELIGALAPRPVFISAPLRDSNFKWDSVDRIVAAAARVYALHGKAGNLAVAHPDCPHDFPDEMRARAYALFDRVLLDAPR